MRIRRPVVAVSTALTLFGGGVALTACGDPAAPNQGSTSDEEVEQLDEEDADRENLPDTHQREQSERDETGTDTN